ncbi:MAG TPA: YceI family protein [Steroidobacteraceae bacterium]|nr:YceI family protein [Steroidobacteraceae bacterium]
MFSRFAVAAAVFILSACVAPRPRPAAPQPPIQPFPSLQSLPPPGAYTIDSQNSELRILVYRAGPLAGLGHNHVMVNRGVTGLVRVGSSISASSFSLEVPVESFVVDDTEARREEGGDFPGDIPPDAKLGTRRNMLGAAVLNAAEFPVITVTGVTLSGTPDALSAELTVGIAGHEARLSAPCSLQGDAHRLTATGSMELRQTAIGLAPYSLLHGALQVEDAMQLKFTIVVPIS